MLRHGYFWQRDSIWRVERKWHSYISLTSVSSILWRSLLLQFDWWSPSFGFYSDRDLQPEVPQRHNSELDTFLYERLQVSRSVHRSLHTPVHVQFKFCMCLLSIHHQKSGQRQRNLHVDGCRARLFRPFVITASDLHKQHQCDCLFENYRLLVLQYLPLVRHYHII